MMLAYMQLDRFVQSHSSTMFNLRHQHNVFEELSQHPLGSQPEDTAPTSLEQDVYSVVETAVKGKGSGLSKEACTSFLSGISRASRRKPSLFGGSRSLTRSSARSHHFLARGGTPPTKIGGTKNSVPLF